MARIKGDKEPVICGVCRRRAYGYGQAPRQGVPIMWLCDDPSCWSVSRKVYSMPDRQLDVFEINARNEAGDAAGAYLDSIGKTDLEKLAPEEWYKFLSLVLTGFEESLRRQFVDHVAPF